MPRPRTDHIVVHGAWTPVGMDIGAEEIREWHTDKGYHDIGYHYVIRRNGLVEDGRPLQDQGAHVRGHNRDSLGICLIGGKPQVIDPDIPEYARWDFNYTIAQMRGLRKLIGQLVKLFPETDVIGHRDFPGVVKDCPGFDVQAWWERP